MNLSREPLVKTMHSSPPVRRTFRRYRFSGDPSISSIVSPNCSDTVRHSCALWMASRSPNISKPLSSRIRTVIDFRFRRGTTTPTVVADHIPFRRSHPASSTSRWAPSSSTPPRAASPAAILPRTPSALGM